MAQINYDSIYPYIRPYVPGCPDLVIDAHIKEALEKFCDDSHLWRYDVASTNTVANTSDYTLALPTDTKISDIFYIKLNGLILDRVSDRRMESNKASSQPNKFAIIDENTIRFYDTPDAVYAFTGRVALKPALAATGMEDFLHENHGRSISYHALGGLLSIPGKTWTDIQLAEYYKKRYTDYVTEAVARDSRKIKPRTKPIYF